MKKHLSLITTALLGIGALTASAQFGGRGGGPNFSDAMAKLFGDHQQFTATMEAETDAGGGKMMAVPGKLSFDEGKTRFEINMAEMKGSAMPPQAAEQMKAMGMDQMVSISRPDKNTMYIIYPGMQSYLENPMPGKSEATSAEDFKLQTTELGNEEADGHKCVKNKVVVTDKQGAKHESTVWNATDLEKFPVKIETAEQGHKAVMHFKNVAFAKPAATVFDPPTDFKKYASMQAMMQEIMMKKMGGMPQH
jgi:hypothetical protein